jgi:hypothetical protein
MIDIDLPLEVDSRIVLALSITAADAQQTIDLPMHVTAAAPVTLDLSLRVSAVSATTQGGLNGAGAWAAAPGGRWEAIATLGGVDISDRLTGEVIVSFADDEARTAEFAFLPATTLQPMSLTGQRVLIQFAQAGGANAQDLFRGVVDVPEIDAQTGVVRCVCTDQLPEVMTNPPREWIDANVGGRWHQAVFGEPADEWEYTQQRISTVPKSIALDVMQSPRVIPWRDLPRTLTVRDADVIDGSLSITLPSRDQMRTRIEVRHQYRYNRLRARGIVAAWSRPFTFFANYGAVSGFRVIRWLTRDMVMGATGSMRGWDLRGDVSMTNPPPGTYFENPGFGFGGYIIPPDVAPNLVMSFSAHYTARWQQGVTETYEIDVVLPDLESMLGRPVAETMGANLQAEFGSRDWQQDATVEPVIAAPMVGDAYTDWQPDGSSTADRDAVLRTLLDAAWVRLYAAQRTGRVRFAIPLRPDIWLDCWMQAEFDRVRAAGKVVEGRHVLNVSQGEAVSEFAIAVGLPGNTGASMPNWDLPAIDTQDPARPPSAYSCTIGAYVGAEINSPPFDEENMVGFSTNRVDGDGANRYPHQLSIQAPDIDAADRDPMELSAAVQIPVAVPTYLLEIDPT